MKKSFTFKAKKVEQAISEGLAQLGVEMSDVEVNIISSGGVFRKAEVEIILEVPDEVKAPTPVAKIDPKTVVTESVNNTDNAVVRGEYPKEINVSEKDAEKKGIKPVKNNDKQKADSGTVSNREKFEKIKADVIANKNKAKNNKNKNNNDKGEPSVEQQSKSKPAFALKYSANSGENLVQENVSNKETIESGQSLRKPKLFERKERPARPESLEKRERVERRSDREPATEEMAQKAKGFLETVLEKGGFEKGLSYNLEDGLRISLESTDSSLIGHHGETLDALQYLTGLIVNEKKEKYTVVSVDVLGYRQKRAETLCNMAQKLADKCIRNNRRMGMEPMNSQDRRTIHAYLGEIEGVVTKSEGFSPNRRIVIYPEKKKDTN